MKNKARAFTWVCVMACIAGCDGEGAEVCDPGASDCETGAVVIDDDYLAKICDYGEPDCNTCADNLIAQVTGDAGLNIEGAYTSFGFPGAIQTVGYHIQGVTRLPDRNGQGRMVITDSGPDAGYRLAFQEISDADEALFSSSTNLHGAVSFPIRNVPAYGNHGHPGGINSQGDVVVVGMEGGAARNGAVYFLRVNGAEIDYVTTLHLDGSRGEPYQANQSAAATAGFIKLDTGRFLLAVSGARNGTQGIWFYESTEDEIRADTSWNYLS